MKIIVKTLLVFMFLMVGVILVVNTKNAGANPFRYSDNCVSCHGAYSNSTCAGCHAHGVHSGTKNDINLQGTTNARVYAPGDLVNVQINGGYRSGWIRAVLYDQNMTVLSRGTGTIIAGATAPCCGPNFPVVLSAPAPATPGAYAWNAAWYGNKYDLSDAGTGSTFFGPRWTPDPNNPNHGYEIVSTNAFYVATTPTPYIQLTPSTLNFGSVGIGASVPLTVRVANLGNGDLTVTDISHCGGTSNEFASSPAVPFTLVPGANQTLSVVYSPVDTGTDTGCFAISSNDPWSPLVDLNVSGTGALPADLLNLNISAFSVTSNFSLKSVKRSQVISVQLSVINPGTVVGSAPATVKGVQNGVLVYNNTLTVSDAPGDTAVTVYVFPSYTPTAVGTITWTATINDPNPDSDTATAVTTVTR